MKRNQRLSVTITASVVMAISLSGCSIFRNKGNLPIHEMDSVLTSGIDGNAALQKAESKKIPTVVSDALLPSLTVSGQSSLVPVAQRFNVNVSNVNARDFFMGLVKDTPYNIIVSPDVSGSITLNLKNVTMQQVLNAVHDIYGYHYQYTPYGFEVYPAGMETKIFNVNVLDIQRYGQSYTNVISGQISENPGAENSPAQSNRGSGGGGSSGSSRSGNVGSLLGGQNSQGSTRRNSNTDPFGSPGVASSVNTRSELNFWHDLQMSLQTIVGKKDGAKVVMNPEASVVIVHAEPQQVQEVADYLDRVQSSMNREVIIDTQIIEVTLDKQFQAGVDWSVLGLHVEATGVVANPSEGVPGISPPKEPDTLPNQLGPFAQVMTLKGKIGSFKGVIQALDTQGNAQVLSNPRISTMNNQEAVIKVGSDQYFITGFNSSTLTNDSGNTSGVGQSVDLAPFFSGIALGVTPQIGSDNVVTLHIHPLVSSVESQELKFQIAGTSKNPQEDKVPLARSTVRESDGIVRAKSGQMIVLGGLMENKVSEHVASVPFLGDIPFLGAAFRRTYQDSKKTELIILMRPIVVEKGTWNKQLKAIKQTYDADNHGFHFGGFPGRFGNLAETEYFTNVARQQDVAQGNKTLDDAKKQPSAKAKPAETHS